MMNMKIWLTSSVAVALLACTAPAADAVASGTIKSINAESKSFVVTDDNSKDNTFKLGEQIIINRGGTEANNNLKVGDNVHVCYDKGLLTWTSHYILIREGSTKQSSLIHGSIKSYDAEKTELTVTNDAKTDTTYQSGKSSLRVNNEKSQMKDVKIGDRALLVVDSVDNKQNLVCVMVSR